MVLIEFAMAPRGQAQSLSDEVARIIDIIDRSGLDYQLTAMGTLLEGEWEDVMRVVTDCFEALKTDCPRISLHLKADYRAGRSGRLRGKVQSVEQKLGRPLRT
jgi:uncharacterized protein (TIGR00106 family)